MMDDATPDLGAGYDRSAVDGDAAEVDNTPLAEGDNAEVETPADADITEDIAADTAPAGEAADAA